MKGVMLIAAVCMALAGCGKSQAQKAADEAAMQEIKTQRVVRGFVMKHLKDPDSAEFRNQSGLCGEVNAKNGFGGYTGYRRFMAANEDLVVFEGGKRLTPAEFDEAWRRAC